MYCRFLYTLIPFLGPEPPVTLMPPVCLEFERKLHTERQGLGIEPVLGTPCREVTPLTTEPPLTERLDCERHVYRGVKIMFSF